MCVEVIVCYISVVFKTQCILPRISSIMLIFHAIFGRERTGVSFIESLILSSALLTSGSLQGNVIDAAINNWTKRQSACVQMDNILNTFYGCSWEQTRNAWKILAYSPLGLVVSPHSEYLWKTQLVITTVPNSPIPWQTWKDCENRSSTSGDIWQNTQNHDVNTQRNFLLLA